MAGTKATFPDHPPYENMIVTAITALKHKRGSSKAILTTYIESVFHNFSDDHPTLLTQNLNKLVQKKLVGVNRFYFINNPESNSTNHSEKMIYEAIRNKKKGKGSRKGSILAYITKHYSTTLDDKLRPLTVLLDEMIKDDKIGVNCFYFLPNPNHELLLDKIPYKDDGSLDHWIDEPPESLEDANVGEGGRQKKKRLYKSINQIMKDTVRIGECIERRPQAATILDHDSDDDVGELKAEPEPTVKEEEENDDDDDDDDDDEWETELTMMEAKEYDDDGEWEPTKEQEEEQEREQQQQQEQEDYERQFELSESLTMEEGVQQEEEEKDDHERMEKEKEEDEDAAAAADHDDDDGDGYDHEV